MHVLSTRFSYSRSEVSVQDFPGLVSTDWLAVHLGSPDLRIVDATLFMPHSGKNGHSEYLRGHIPGAVFFDIDAASAASPLPNMLPDPARFAAVAGTLGISNEDRVVTYDAQGVMSSPRLWWMFRVFGHERVAVLDGGLPKWRREDRGLESGSHVLPKRDFLARHDIQGVKTIQQVEFASMFSSEQIIDARSAARFAGREAEPRPGLRRGHIPHSFNVPYTSLIDHTDGTLLHGKDLRAKFVEAGIDPEQPAICTCGSGISACVVAFALNQLGNRDVAVYDGSWSEWGTDPARAVAVGVG